LSWFLSVGMDEGAWVLAPRGAWMRGHGGGPHGAGMDKEGPTRLGPAVSSGWRL
jgi:hypothetical protein